MGGLLLEKLALVTGAGSGIGRATCRLFVRNGAKVIAGDVNFNAAKATSKEIGKDFVTPIQIDVSSLDSVQRAVRSAKETFKKAPSIIVNSAGIVRDGYLLKFSEKEYDEVYDVNLKGTFLVTQQFAKAMIEEQISGGSIINLSSIVAKTNNIGQSNYAAMKSGVISFTEVASKEFGKFGIRVNAVLPGYINTPMVATIPDNIKKLLLERCPLGRIGEPEEIAEVITFLASAKSSYINGASIEVTGGLK